MPKCLLYSACRTYVFLFAVAAATAVNYQTVCCAYALVALTLFLGWQERQPVNILLQNAWNWISSWCKWSGYSLEYTLLIPPAYVKKKTTKSFQSVPWTHTQYKNDWGLRSRRQPINPGLLGKWPFKQCVCTWVLPYSPIHLLKIASWLSCWRFFFVRISVVILPCWHRVVLFFCVYVLIFAVFVKLCSCVMFLCCSCSFIKVICMCTLWISICLQPQ